MKVELSLVAGFIYPKEKFIIDDKKLQEELLKIYSGYFFRMGQIFIISHQDILFTIKVLSFSLMQLGIENLINNEN